MSAYAAIMLPWPGNRRNIQGWPTPEMFVGGLAGGGPGAGRERDTESGQWVIDTESGQFVKPTDPP